MKCAICNKEVKVAKAYSFTSRKCTPEDMCIDCALVYQTMNSSVFKKTSTYGRAVWSAEELKEAKPKVHDNGLGYWMRDE